MLSKIIEQIEKEISTPDQNLLNSLTSVEFVNLCSGLKLYDYQEDILNSIGDNTFITGQMPRRVGQTTLLSGHVLWKAITKPNSSIAMSGSNHTLTMYCRNRVIELYERLPEQLKVGIVSNSKYSIEFINGSSIRFINDSQTIRGLGAVDIVMDNFNLISETSFEEFIAYGKMYHSGKMVTLITK